MPGANFWSVFFFLTLLLLGISSTYPMLDVIVTFLQDRWHAKIKRIYMTTGLCVAAFLISIMYSTRAGYYVLDGVDRWINNMTLVFVVWSEVALSTSIYRYTDLFEELGKPAYLLYNAGYFLAQILGVAVGHAVMPAAGAGVGFGIYIFATIAAVVIAKAPVAKAPRFWGKNPVLAKFWFLAFYSVRPLANHIADPQADNISRVTSSTAT
jgi:solute carrier family 6 (neurotransmitter transporter, GABA) member 1